MTSLTFDLCCLILVNLLFLSLSIAEPDSSTPTASPLTVQDEIDKYKREFDAFNCEPLMHDLKYLIVFTVSVFSRCDPEFSQRPDQVATVKSVLIHYGIKVELINKYNEDLLQRTTFREFSHLIKNESEQDLQEYVEMWKKLYCEMVQNFRQIPPEPVDEDRQAYLLHAGYRVVLKKFHMYLQVGMFKSFQFCPSHRKLAHLQYTYFRLLPIKAVPEVEKAFAHLCSHLIEKYDYF